MSRLVSALILVALGGMPIGCDQLSGGAAGEKSAKGDEDKDDDEDKDKGDDDGKKGKSKKKKAAKGDDAEEEKPDFSKEDAFVSKHLALLHDAAGCASDKRMEPWCRFTKGFPNGKAELPSRGTRLGVTTFVQTVDATPTTLDKHAHLTSFAARKDGDTFVVIAQVTPDNDGEAKSVKAAQESVIDVLRGDSKRVEATSDLVGYLSGLPDTAKYRVEEHDRGIRADGGSRADIRRVGTTWLSVEVPPNNPAGMWVSIFTDAEFE